MKNIKLKLVSMLVLLTTGCAYTVPTYTPQTTVVTTDDNGVSTTTTTTQSPVPVFTRPYTMPPVYYNPASYYHYPSYNPWVPYPIYTPYSSGYIYGGIRW